MHPYIVETAGADHQRRLRRQAEDHRRARQAQAPAPETATGPRRRWFALQLFPRRTRTVEAS